MKGVDRELSAALTKTGRLLKLANTLNGADFGAKWRLRGEKGR
jgi:hypothetical protein